MPYLVVVKEMFAYFKRGAHRDQTCVGGVRTMLSSAAAQPRRELSVLLVCLVPWLAVGQTAATSVNQTRTTFPAPRRTSNYARLTTPLSQDLQSLTVCLHMRTDMSSSSDVALVSYAVTGQHNELLVFNNGGRGFKLFVQGKETTMGPLPVWDGAWHALCVTWGSSDGAWQVFVDGVLKGSGTRFFIGGRVRSGGTWILAQEQDRVGGGFDANQAFSGELSQVNLWDRVLSPAEVGADWTTFCNHHGNVIDWATANIQVLGQAISDQHRCQATPVPSDNVALGKTAYQTSISSGGAASRAVDGYTDGNYHTGSCTHTTAEADPTWWVDLGQSYMVSRVVIFNRISNCCSERLNPFNIHIGDSDQVSTNPKCGGDHNIDVNQPSITVSCQGMKGRYVGVRLPGPSRILTLCEVQVFRDNGFRDNKGTEFVLSFIQNFKRDGHRPQLLITGTSLDLTSVVVDVPVVGFTKTVNVRFGEVTTVRLPRDGVEMLGSRKGRHAISIQADDDIIVYGVFTERDSSDGYLGLPTNALGTEYLVPCNTVTRNRPEEGFVHIPSEFGLVGVYDNTTVNIVPRQRVIFEDQTYNAMETIATTLDKFDTLQIQSSDDLTGSRIISNKPVAVLSGNMFTTVGHPDSVRGSGTHIVEMIPPVHTWGKEFALVPLKERDQGDIFRVLAARDGTQVNLTGSVPRTLRSGEFWEFNLPSYSYKHLASSEPVLLVQYSKSKTVDQARADPFMMLVPAVSQFAANYSFSTVDFADLHLYGTYHLNIVVSTSEKDGLRLDDNPLDSEVQWSVIPGTQMSAARVDVRCGSHTLVHLSPAVTFGVYMYGFTDWDGYGYPGGLHLSAHFWRSSSKLQNVGSTGQSIGDDFIKPQPRDNRKGDGNMVSTNTQSKTVQWKDYTESKVLIVGFCALLLVSIIAGLLYIKNRWKDNISSTSMEALELEGPSIDQ